MEKLRAISQIAKLGSKTLDMYYQPKKWENGGKIYEALGVRKVKRYFPTLEPTIRLVRRITKENLPGFSLESPTQNNAKKYEKYTRIYEAIHIIGVTIGIHSILGTINVLAQTKSINFDFNFFGNGLAPLLVNCYAVMIQRYNRARIYRLSSRKQQS